ncbi:hypothetical protein D3Z31_09880 [Lactobacillus murinus]|nr:hypothetical protein [Ligilactobacillus murinus]RII77200.1 hypothetical protein D1870_09880 [Ligilactobacillus murinus]
MLFARWAEAGAPRFMNTDHLTEKYIAICKKWEQNGSNSLPLWGFKLKWEQSGSILVAKREQFAPTLLPFSFLDNSGQGKCPASGLEPLRRPLRGCKSFP